MPSLRFLFFFVVLFSAGGCSTLDYYWQTANGGLDVLRKRQPIEQVLRQPGLDEQLKGQLQLATQVRDFASRELGLPENGSYRSYADLGREYAVWNIVATEEFSVAPRRWCFLLAGCFNYKGFFDPQMAQHEADGLSAGHWDVYLYGVSAYSTLGWFDDPLLNTMLKRNDTRLARVIIHELSHQQLFVSGDSDFNEAFATAVERIGTERWLRRHGDQQALRDFKQSVLREDQFHDLLLGTRAALATLFDAKSSVQEKRAGKQAIYERLREEHAKLKQAWGCEKCYDYWFDSDLNNARLALVATYRQRVPAFFTLYRQADEDMTRFFQQARQLSELPKEQRDKQLETLANGTALARN